MAKKKIKKPSDQDTTARYVVKTKVYILGHGGRQGVLDVSCRDINKVFAENPALVELYGTIFMIRFFNTIYAKVLVDGKEIDTESRDPIDYSPRFFMPGQGRIFTVDDVKDRDDDFSKELMTRMAMHNITSGFLDMTTNLMVPAETEKGDRILDESEINDFGQKASAPVLNTEPEEPEESEDQETPDTKKKIYN